MNIHTDGGGEGSGGAGVSGDPMPKRIASLWCEMDDETQLQSFAFELALALQEYAALLIAHRAGHHQSEAFTSSNGVRLMLVETRWNGAQAPYQDGRGRS